MRLIDADKAKEKLRGNAQKDGNPFVGAIVEMFCEFLDQVPTVEDAEERSEIGSVPRWIPVTERLPEFDEIVLAYCPRRKGTPNKTQTMRGWAAMVHASHWMPIENLPEVE